MTNIITIFSGFSAGVLIALNVLNLILNSRAFRNWCWSK